MEIKNLKKAAERILKAINSKEKIILYGDADLDGVTSVIILKEAIKNLGGKTPIIYFPDREFEGYGITEKGLNFLKQFAPALLISLDCGIGNFKEMKLAKEMGFETIVIDHHEMLDELPEASIIVDPKQKDDPFPFKEFATVGISFKLAEILLGEKMSENLRKNFLELVAIGTLADMMPEINENRIFIEEGLREIEDSFRPGIRVFFEKNFLNKNNKRKIISKLISILNVRDMVDNFPASFRLLTIPSFEEARELFLKLKIKNEIKKEKIKKIIEEIEEKISKNPEPIIFEGDDGWDVSFISIIASSLSQKFKKPAFIYKKLEKESQGTVRVPPGIDSVALMKKCKEYLITFGGHKMASGFRIKNENLDNFKRCLIENLCEK
jgi:single-stranded-DNA-specific exonuclease